MLDIKYIRDNPDETARRLATRGGGDDKLIAQALVHDETRRKLLQQVETLKAERNLSSKEVGARKSKGENVDDLLARGKEISDRISALDKQVAEIEATQQDLLLGIKNIPHPSVPVGPDDTRNPVVRTHGEKPTFSFEPRTHWDLGEKLGMLNFAQATKLAGSGFILFRGDGARLERALINFLLDLHTTEHGYTEISPPVLVRRECLIGTGQLPKFDVDNMYEVKDENLYLIPTAEVPVTNLHREEILSEKDLPIRYAAYTPCFRREAGSAGKDTRGMIRVHQFDKVELVHVVKPEDSYATLETLVCHAERVLKELRLTYRVIEHCTGDLGFTATKSYDIDVWAPGLQAWLEVSSCSNFEDFQARRMNLRYKGSDGKNVFCHTLNGSGTALPRLFIALLETHQQADGHILIPLALQPFFGKDKI
jgi:seryl-tRNA synthetase